MKNPVRDLTEMRSYLLLWFTQMISGLMNTVQQPLWGSGASACACCSVGIRTSGDWKNK